MSAESLKRKITRGLQESGYFGNARRTHDRVKPHEEMITKLGGNIQVWEERNPWPKRWEYKVAIESNPSCTHAIVTVLENRQIPINQVRPLEAHRGELAEIVLYHGPNQGKVRK